MPATDSEVALYDAIRADVLAFSEGTTTVASILGVGAAARFYMGSPPDFATWPGTFAVLRIIDPYTSDFGSGMRITFRAEFSLFGRPRSKAQEVLRLASLIDGAMLRYTKASAADGLVRATGRAGGGLMPAGTGDVDREVVQYFAPYEAFAWPKWLTKYSHP
jgi:hypothetical protein